MDKSREVSEVKRKGLHVNIGETRVESCILPAWPCELRKLTWPFQVKVSSSIKWGWQCLPLSIDKNLEIIPVECLVYNSLFTQKFFLLVIFIDHVSETLTVGTEWWTQWSLPSQSSKLFSKEPPFQLVHEKMLSTTNCQGNAHEHHNEIPTHTCW